MTKPNSEEPSSADSSAWLNDWVTVWQSELTALAMDREAQECWEAMFAAWSRAANLLARASLPDGLASPPVVGRHTQFAKHNDERAPGGARTDATSWSAPIAPASGIGDSHADELERLRARIAELEQRLANLE